MSNLAMCAHRPPASVSVADGAGTAANLLTVAPKEAWIGAAGTSTLIADLGRVRSWDTVFLGFTTAAPGATWALRHGDGPAGDAVLDFAGLPIVEPLVAPGFEDETPRNVHLYARLPVPGVSRYVRIEVTQPAGWPALRASILSIGSSFAPTYNFELGGGRGLVDTGSRERLIDGGFGTAHGVTKGLYQWTFGDLSDDETQALYAFARTRGENRPLIVAEDPDATVGLQERLHYCVFDRLEPYERREVGKTRWAFRVEEWA